MKKILEKIKSLLKYKKMFSKIKNFIKTKKLLSIIILAAIIAGIAVGILFAQNISEANRKNIKINKQIFTIAIDPNGSCIYNVNGKIYTLSDTPSLYKYSGISNFYITTLSGAYKIEKDYLVYKEGLDALPSSISGTIISDIYSVVPKNGENILSMQPIYVTFRLPGTIDKNKADYQIVRISGNSSVIPLKGAYLHSDGSNYYITAKVYHLSKFALKYIGTINIKREYGLKEVYSVETRGAGRPILIIGGIDKTIYDVDFWMNMFPNRSIWFYYYPTTETRSLLYQSTVDNIWQNLKNYIASKYKITLNRESYIISQASLFKQKLLEIQQTKKYINFDIIASGIGGLIARWSLEGLPNENSIKNVKNLYLLDVPNNGLASVDPNRLKDIYGSSNAFIKKQFSILDLDQVKWFTNRLITMLDNYSPFIQDIIPSSVTIAILNKATSLDKNITYHNFCGVKPIFDIKYIPGSRIEDEFPLFVNGKGDGRISIYDANIQGLNLITLNSNFLQVYQNKNFIAYVKTGYIENQEGKIANVGSEIKITNPSATEINVGKNRLKFYDKNIYISKNQQAFKQQYAVNYYSSDFRIFNGKNYYIYPTKIVSGKNTFSTNGYLTDIVFYSDNIYTLDFSNSVLYVLNQNLSSINNINLSKNKKSIYNLIPTEYGVFYYNFSDKTVYMLSKNNIQRKYITLPDRVITIDYQNKKLLVQTKKDIRIFDVTNGNVVHYYKISEFYNVPSNYGTIKSFIKSYIYKNYLYIVTDNYTLFGIDLNNPEYINKISGISEVTGKFLVVNDSILIVGKRVIIAYKGIDRLPWFYKVPFEISDSFEYGNNLYLVSNNGKNITVRKLIPNW